MSTEPGYSGTNIMLTIQGRIGNSITVGAETVPVLYGWWADPDNTRSPGTTPAKSYVVVTWSEMRAGLKGAHILNLDVFTLIGPESGGDPHGIRCNKIADALVEIFRAPYNDRFLVRDFTDPSMPMDTSICLYTVGPNSARGFPTMRQFLPWEDGLNRVRLTFQFKTVVDRSWYGGIDP